jgi:hypothetical protein
MSRIVVLSQPGQKSLREPISMEKKLRVVVHTCYPNNRGRPKLEGSQSKLAWKKASFLQTNQPQKGLELWPKC